MRLLERHSSQGGVIYSSINFAVEILKTNYGTMMSNIKFSYLYGSNKLILSLNPLTIGEQELYSEAPVVGPRFQMFIEVFNSLGQSIHSFDSARNLHK
jgi:hypothetical protein